MDTAASRPVSLPVPNPTPSYWQDPPDPLADHRTTADLPTSADYIIVGSGITGASIAHFLLAQQPHTRVVMLEARQASSGATGRNGGHTKAASYREHAANTASLGAHEADRIARLEAANVAAQRDLAARLGIECDMRATPTVDVYYDAAALAAGEAAAKRMNEQTDGPVERYTLLGAADAAARYACPGACGAIAYEAGSVAAYALACGLLRDACGRGMNLQTGTPATRVEHDGGKGEWVVTTPRGDVRAGAVVLATNGYTAALEPVFQGTIVPLRGQVAAQRPGAGLQRRPSGCTYTFAYADGYEYMIPRTDGTLVIGGGWATLPDGGACEFGETDDGAVNDAVGAYLRECTVRYFSREAWGADDARGRTAAQWTGVMGTSADGRPYVGRVPGRPAGLWVCASFNGHGMALCVKCASALVGMMTGGDEEGGVREWFPESFRMGKHRLGVEFKGRRNARVEEHAKA